MRNSNHISKPFSHHEFLDACAQTGCPVCRIGAQTVRRQLKVLFYEYVNDRERREALVKSLGFCGEHVRLLLSHKIADSLGASIIYEHLVKVVLREFPKQASNIQPKELSRKFDELTSASEGLGECLACKRRQEVVQYTLHQIGISLNDAALREALDKSDGFCFPHLSQLFLEIQKPADADFLLTLTRSKLEKRQSEMAEVIRKNDHRFSSEQITLDEALAWKKAMVMLSGVSIHATGDQYE
ncbi:MAG TPA: DUF6062 family protein [Anaerolineales bacterium]|nr:DUF6062 family protein [Anaerolineales bacterium]